MVTAAEKREIIEKFGRKTTDTGSPEVQIALITKRITQLTEHFKIHMKDFHSRRGLLILVGRRRRLLDFLMKTNMIKYRDLIKSLGLRK